MILNKYFKYILLLFFLFIVGTANSQLFLSGEDPASIKWQQINTEKFQIIFPDGFEKQAQYFANALEQSYEYGAETLKVKPRKISVLLHTQSVISNGTTGWAPARIDVYNTPPQDHYPVNWFAQLAVHEFRHVVQIERINTGLTKVLGALFGQQAAVGMTGAYLPWWFIEGDAVVTETALSKFGRGRLPSFKMPLKAQLLECGKYSYEKATHGSFKDYTPSFYHLGYQIVAYGRSKYGADFWDEVVGYTGRNPLGITSFSSGIKKQTGLSKRKFYVEAMNFLEDKWTQVDAQIETTDFRIITSKPKYFSSYVNPVSLSDRSMIAFKTSMDDVTKIVKIHPNGNEEILLTPGPTYRESLSASENLICWSEIESDLRWSQRSFSVIKIYNADTKVLANLTTKCRYHSPSLNPEGTKVVAIKVSDRNEYSMVILDVLSAQETYTYQSKDNAFLMHPSWSEDGKKIVMTIFNGQGKNLRILNLETNSANNILEYSYAEISRPQIFNNRVYFIADYSGIDNLYAYDFKTQNVTQVTSVRFGVGNYTYNYNQQQLLFSNYTAEGFAIAEQKINTKNEKALSQIEKNNFTFVDELVKHEKGIVEVNQEDLKNYEVKKYPKSTGLFNVHSWSPFSMDLVDYEIKPGIMFMSQNLLSTAITTLGYEYDLSEEVGKYYANFEYRGWYPVIDFNIEYGKERAFYRYTDTLDQHHQIPFTFHELETSIGISQLLNFSKNQFISGLMPFVRLKHTYRKIDEGYEFRFTEPDFQSLEYGFSAYHYLRSSLRDIYPKWGIIGHARYIHTPFTSLQKSDMLVLEGIVYAPGFFKHHGFKLYAATQLRTVGDYNPSNVVPFMRGMSNPGLHDLYRLSVDYKFPLFYPDWDLASVLYLKRLTMDLFYDYAYGTAPDFKQHYHSFGTELQAQMHVLSFLAPVNLGFRAIYFPDISDYSLTIFFNIDFSLLK